MEALSEAEQASFSKFCEAVRDIRPKDHDDLCMLRWMKARVFNVKKAEAMYRKSMQWRRDVGADSILTDYEEPEVVRRYYPGGICGTDLAGRPVCYDALGQIDLKGLMHCVTKATMIRVTIYRLEKLHAVFRQLSAESGQYIHQCVQLIDMQGFGANLMWKPAMDVYIELLRLLSDNYPETLHKTLIINAPKIFKVGYNVLTKFLDEGTVSKMTVCDGRWEDELFALVSKDELPTHYGGTKCGVDDDPKCQNEICYGGKVPLELYCSQDDCFPPDAPSESLVLGRRSRLPVTIQLSASQPLGIRYIFATESGDIGFTVYHRAETPEGESAPTGRQATDRGEEIQPYTKYDCHLVPEDGMVPCHLPGTYTLEFHNPSRLYTRKFRYCVQLTGVTDDQQIVDVTKEHDAIKNAPQEIDIDDRL